MTTAGSLNYQEPSTAPRPRVWFAAVIVIVQWLIIKIPAWVAPQTMWQFMAMVWGPILGLLAVLIWWLGLSRFPWRVRWLGLVALILGPVAGFVVGHPSMRMGMVTFGLPVATTVFVVWILVGRFFSARVLRVGVLVSPFLVWAFLATLRMDGLDGSINFKTSLRWSPTAEERYLAKIAQDPALAGRKNSLAPATAPAELTLADGDWPAFRGANRDGKLTGVTINADWAGHPPKLLWKHLSGPGWSSFSVVGDHAFTQEQRGQTEAVVCYNLDTGDQIWLHDDSARFDESMGGPGPRATPTFADGKLYVLGATGVLNCLKATTGEKIWSRDVRADTSAPLPMWGFSASPLVANGIVAVISGGKGKSLIAYNALTDQPVWSVGDGWSYASVQLSRIDGVDQMLAVTQEGMFSVDPATGQILWQHSFPIGQANRVVQPAILNDSDLLLGVAFGIGTRRIKVTHDGNGWNTQTVWTSRSFKPYYNDMVLHKGNIYGFDGSAFVCIDPATGKARWRAHGYGNGQVLLIADQDLLLILSEQGEAALVDAKPEEYHEIAKFQALTGKTWNHPVIAHGKLLVRNGEEVACYEVK